MITNRLEHTRTLAWVKRFENAIAASEEEQSDLHPLLLKAQRDGAESIVEGLKRDLAAYDAIITNSDPTITADFGDLGDVLRLARTLAGLTQAQLAEKLGKKPQQIQHWEACGYEQTSLGRLQLVAWALGIDIQVVVKRKQQEAHNDPTG